MAKRKVIWTKMALRQFESSIKYIQKKSPQNAAEVREKILEKVNALESGLAVHRKDPYKRGNDGSIVYFEVLKHRIAYQVRGSNVFIIRIRHTGMEPKPY